jgi:hypothetical protein
VVISDAITPEVVARLAQRMRDLYSSLSDGEKLLFKEFCQASSREDEVTGLMRADFSTTTFDPGRHFVRVLMQQGRVQLDADASQASVLSRQAELAFALLGMPPPK